MEPIFKHLPKINNVTYFMFVWIKELGLPHDLSVLTEVIIYIHLVKYYL